MKLRLAWTVKRLNVEHRTSNIERRILMTLRFIDFKTSESRWRRDLKTAEPEKSEPQNRRTAECRMSKGGVATLGLFYKIDRSTKRLTTGRSTKRLTTGRIHYSMLDVQCSMFDVHFLVNSSCETTFPKFHFRLDWSLFRPAAGLTPETYNNDRYI